MLAESVISAISVALTCEKGGRDLVQIVRFDKNIAAPVAECWDPNEVKYQQKALLVERIGRASGPESSRVLPQIVEMFSRATPRTAASALSASTI